MITSMIVIASGFLIILTIVFILVLLEKQTRNETIKNSTPDYYGYSQPVTIPKCLHKGERTNVVMWVSTTCEQVHVVCDDCGESLEIYDPEC